MITDENYDEAWEVLKNSFEKRRIVINKYLDILQNLSCPSPVTAESLSDIVNTVHQCLTSLKNFKIDLDTGLERFVVRVIEKILPKFLREEWEKTLDLDNLPSLKQIFAFLESVAFRFESLKQGSEFEKSKDKRETGQKRKGGSFGNVMPVTKVRKPNEGLSAFVTQTVDICGYCGDKTHGTYRCDKFQALSIQSRWDAVRFKKLCFNCLRNHGGKCGITSRCKQCNKPHHTLLHSAPKGFKTGNESVRDKPGTSGMSKPA